jgi:hypothetical protein
MGWQDAPEVGGGGWQSAPIVGEEKPNLKKQLAEGTSSGEAFKIAAGSMGTKLWEGLQQSGMGMGAIFSELLPRRLKEAAQDELQKKLLAQEKRMRETGGAEEYANLEKAHPIATALGEASPLVAAPMLRVASGPGMGAAAVNSAASAALPAAIEYGTPEEKGKRAATAGAFGGVAGGLTAAAAKVLQGVTNQLTPEARRLAGLAESKFNIPLDAADKTGNKSLQTMNAVMESMPATAGAEAAKRTAQKQAFTREVMRTTGETAEEATGATWEAAKKRLGGDFERIFGKVHVNLDDEGVQAGLSKVVQEAADTLPPDQAAVVVKRVGHLLDKIDDNGAVAGKAYQAWRSQVQKQAEGSSDQWLGTQLRNLYRTVDEAAYKAAADAGEDVALRTARSQYRNLKTIKPIVDKSTDGTISPRLLLGQAKGMGGDLEELGKIGHRFVAEQVPNSGTPQRALAQSLMTGGLVGGGTLAAGGSPEDALKFGVGALALPKTIQAITNSGAGQRYLAKGIRPDLTPLELALMERAARLGTLGAAQGISDQ